MTTFDLFGVFFRVCVGIFELQNIIGRRVMNRYIFEKTKTTFCENSSFLLLCSFFDIVVIYC